MEIPGSVARFARRAMHRECSMERALELVERHEYRSAGWGRGRGRIGALAAIGADGARSEWTYERICYRPRDRWGTERVVDRDSVFDVAETYYPAIWDTVDRDENVAVCVPRTPGPVLFGIRGEGPRVVRRAADAIDHEPITIESEPASEWLDATCDGRGMPFSVAHRYLEDHNDQDRSLPCGGDDGGSTTCPAIAQWDRYREGDHPLVIATHNFAYAPGLRAHNNIIIDEEPDYVQDLSTDRVRQAVGAYLRHVDAHVQTWEAFIQLARYEDYGDDAANERDALEADLDAEPDREWYFEEPDAHILAPALPRAIFHAEERANNRRVGKETYNPLRLEANARDDEDWNQEWVSVVLDDSNDVRSVRVVPDLQAARSVVGLDAHPALPKWQANTVPWIQSRAVLDPQERRLWRRYERGLRVVQVGEATRPLANGEYFDRLGTGALLEQLIDEYGPDAVRTAITAQSVESEVKSIIRDIGTVDPDTMHFGVEKSRNDYADEDVGVVLGSIDPGDDPILDLLAELDLDAEPERADPDAYL